MPSYADDFSMYYSGSVITDGRGRVLRVDHTDRNSRIRDPYQNIVFVCSLVDENGRLVDDGICVPYADAILDLPPLGCFLIGSTRVFARYANARTVKKGMSRNRIRIGSRGRGSTPSSGEFLRIAYQAYNNTGFEGKLSDTAFIHRNRLYYKGSQVGTVHDGNITMYDGLEYLEQKVRGWMSRGGR